MILYTAQYRYSGKDRLDITVKGKDPIGKIFAPTWKMEMTSKQGKLSWEEYSAQYRQLMRESFQRQGVPGKIHMWSGLWAVSDVTA